MVWGFNIMADQYLSLTWILLMPSVVIQESINKWYSSLSCQSTSANTEHHPYGRVQLALYNIKNIIIAQMTRLQESKHLNFNTQKFLIGASSLFSPPQLSVLPSKWKNCSVILKEVFVAQCWVLSNQSTRIHTLWFGNIPLAESHFLFLLLWHD